MATFSERLEKLRRERGWKRADMYRAMGIAPGTLSNYLSGKASPNIDAVREYSKKLGVSLTWLSGEETDVRDFAPGIIQPISNLEPSVEPLACVPYPTLFELIAYREKLRMLCDIIASNTPEEEMIHMIYMLTDYGHMEITNGGNK